MAVTAVAYNDLKEQLLKGTIDLSSNTIKVALCTSSYTPNIDTHDFFDDITNEVSASGSYTAGGGTLANKTVTQNNTTDKAVFDADDLAFTSATITARYGIIYKSTGTASTSPLIGYVDFGADVTSTAGTFTITWDSTGILTLA